MIGLMLPLLFGLVFDLLAVLVIRKSGLRKLFVSIAAASHATFLGYLVWEVGLEGVAFTEVIYLSGVLLVFYRLVNSVRLFGARSNYTHLRKSVIRALLWLVFAQSLIVLGIVTEADVDSVYVMYFGLMASGIALLVTLYHRSTLR